MKKALFLLKSIISLILVTGWLTTSPATQTLAEGQIITSTPKIGVPGTTVQITGTCFTPSMLPTSGANGTVISYADIYFPDKDTLVKSAVINTWGNLETDIRIEDIPAGDYTIWVHDRSGGPLAWVSTSFSVIPGITLSNDSGYVNDSISITGKGFNTDNWVQLFFNTQQIMLAPTDPYGNFSIEEFIVPKDSKETNTIKIRDSLNNEVKQAFAVQLQKVQVSPNSSPPEKELFIEGSGFRTTSRIMFSMHSATNSYSHLYPNHGIIRTDEEGDFSGYVLLPNCPADDYVLEAFDGESRNGAALKITAMGTFNRSIGFVGTNVTYNGTGFPAMRYAVVTFDDIPLTEAMSDISGTVNITFSIPPCSAGNHIICITDGTIEQLYNFSVLSKARLDINRNFAYPGSEILLSGTGFMTGKVAIISYDGEPVIEVTVDEEEVFSANFTVPSCTGGIHTISVSDGMNEVSRQLEIDGDESDASTGTGIFIPPQLVTPDQYSASGSDVILSWKDENGLENVKYKLQIANDIIFNEETIITEVTDIEISQYVFVHTANTTNADAVFPFFWRVKALDTGNAVESSWSEAREFIIFPFGIPDISTGENGSPFSLSVIVEIGALAFLLIFWLVRKRRYQSQVQPQAS